MQLNKVYSARERLTNGVRQPAATGDRPNARIVVGTYLFAQKFQESAQKLMMMEAASAVGGAHFVRTVCVCVVHLRCRVMLFCCARVVLVLVLKAKICALLSWQRPADGNVQEKYFCAPSL